MNFEEFEDALDDFVSENYVWEESVEYRNHKTMLIKKREFYNMIIENKK